ncbi:hypothetical protein CRG98_036816 [Punica granatum]|uniref:Uncharacterized protein n=1 Tax=Punica granatum TaxID=22663 RepID=A0A2I0IGI4_PUNGR|nr:hypothetical protein CRG98_036816 [Punica granatum]
MPKRFLKVFEFNGKSLDNIYVASDLVSVASDDSPTLEPPGVSLSRSCSHSLFLWHSFQRLLASNDPVRSPAMVVAASDLVEVVPGLGLDRGVYGYRVYPKLVGTYPLRVFRTGTGIDT